MASAVLFLSGVVFFGSLLGTQLCRQAEKKRKLWLWVVLAALFALSFLPESLMAAQRLRLAVSPWLNLAYLVGLPVLLLLLGRKGEKRMYKKFVLLALAVPFSLTGCWDKKDPEDRAFIITLGADAAENGCHFTFAPANIETGEAEIYAAESETLSGAVAQVDTYTSRKTDLGQLKTVILGEGLLRDSARLDALLGELERSQAVSRIDAWRRISAAVSVEKAAKEDSKTGLFLWDGYKNTGEEVAVTKGIDLDTFLTERTERGGNGVLPRIRAEGERLRLGGGMAVSARGASILNEEEERGYLFLLGDAEGRFWKEGIKRRFCLWRLQKQRRTTIFRRQGTPFSAP